jgi:hypothetical protein
MADITDRLPDEGFVVADGVWGEYHLVAGGYGLPPQFRPADLPPVEALSQRYRDWRSVLLGFSQYTIGSQGCALTGASMVARLIDTTLTPPVLQERLKPVGGFWHANLNWAAVPQVVPGLTFDGITNWADSPADMDAIKAHLAQHPLILWIDYTPGGAQQSHFVLALQYLDEYDDIMIADPWDGYSGRMLLRYGLQGWTAQRAIYGMRPLYVTTEQAPAAARFSALAASPQFDDYPEVYKP